VSLPLVILFGLGMGGGAAIVLAALLPSRPDLGALLHGSTHVRATDSGSDDETRWQHLLRTFDIHPGRAAALVRLPARDLDILGRTPAHHGVRKLIGGTVGVAAPGLLLGALALAGLAPGFAASSAACLAASGLGFVLPDVDARAKAARARAQVRAAVTAYLVLVALERNAGSAAQQALVQAARVSNAWVFDRIRAALDHAQLQRRPAWEGLRTLAVRIDVPELADCADIMASATDGAAVADNLLARADALRRETLAHQRGAANKASERMVVPVAALGLCFIALLIYPVTARLLAA
jgi:hypothetical protein